MKNYLDLAFDIILLGNDRVDRTGVGTKALFCETLKFKLYRGFPAVTTKKLAFKAVVGELLGFIKGTRWNQDFEELGCKVWKANSESEYWLSNPNHSGKCGDLGRIYGVQWRAWRAVDKDGRVHFIDQLSSVIERLKTNPYDRRLIVSAWNPGELDQMALPPCHMLFQFFVREEQGRKILDMMMLQRSCDMGLGVPFNIASYALLQCMIAQVVGYSTGVLKLVLNDVHIYQNHIPAIQEQLGRDPYPLPILKMNEAVTNIDDFKPEDFELLNYQHHPHITMEMAV